MPLVRFAVVALALACCAWFALSARQAHELAQATVLVGAARPLSPAQARRAHSLLSSAGTLNPDRQVDVMRGELAIDEGQFGRAEQILKGVTSAEPDNLAAWIQLARASVHDRVSFFAAEIHIRQLVRRFPAGH